ncbi:hypothetical protein Scep_000078 [Stephania cephalantha]|uniref:Dolichyl-diphosphooligosaccharide--protein glycosyltransferase subunit 1 n=1 Tax=Stephania cephalantha TaxID=152367 RepID=A0AAP0Q230_9MAGN
METRFALFFFFFLSIALLSTPVFSDLVITKVDRKVENAGPDVVSQLLLTFPEYQAKKLAYLTASSAEGKGKSKGSSANLPVEVVQPEGVPPALTFYSVPLPRGLGKGESLNLDVFAVLTHSLQPFPEEITQADVQLVLFQDSAHYLSPYEVKAQVLSIKLPSPRVESFTKIQNTKLVDSEIKYGPYENLPAFSYSPIIVHYENNRPFAVATELLREIEISHWGNVQITEHYKLEHGGARTKGGFSRIDYQARPNVRGASSFRRLIVKLPPRAHSVYYRDEIGNVSTSHLWADSRKTELEIEPRYPMFGGWKTFFTVGYGLPLHDYLFESDGKRFLNISFGSPIAEVALPEGSKDISVSVPFSVKQWDEVKYSHLDISGRPVVVLEKKNAVPEHNSHFQWYEVQATVQKLHEIMVRCLTVHDKLEASLRDLSRTGDVQACKATRKAADSLLKELSKDLKPLLVFLQSSLQAAQIYQKVEELVVKEKELQEKLMLKHTMVVDAYEKKSAGRELENRIAALQQKLTTLRQEVDDLIDVIDEI